MIELLLEAERALAVGLIDQAERLYRQAADADPRNAIAVVGLARVALERDDEVAAWQLARLALTIDPEDAAAQRLVSRLEEVFRHRGQALPDAGEGPADAGRVPEPMAVSAAPVPSAAPASSAAPLPSAAAAPPAAPASSAAARGGLIDRLLRRSRP